MPQQTYPRPNHHHALTASDVLTRHAVTIGSPVNLPVPIELIIEQTYRLEILWDEVDEPLGAIVLGKLEPHHRRISLNTRHESLFEQYIGPERFTLAHELAHWIYDADSPDQLAFDLGVQPETQYCYYRESPGLSEVYRIREMNANKLAAHLLLPEDLVRNVSINQILGDFSGTAEAWQVSRTTLRIRLQELGLIDERQNSQLDLL